MRTVKDLLSECQKHIEALDYASQSLSDLTANTIHKREPGLIAALDQFAYRFTKLQDTLSSKLLRAYAVEVLMEPVENSPTIDILNLFEKYRLIPSVSRWQQIREMRNQITHEYTMNAQDLIDTVREAEIMVSEMKSLYIRLSENA